MAVAAVPEPASDLVDPRTGWLDGVLDGLAEGVAECAGDGCVVSDAARVDRIARLEKVKAAAAALQLAESVRFAQSQAEAQLAADVHPHKIGRGIADQLGLACHVSGFEAARRLGVARGLWFDLPETYRLLVAGQISEYVASLVVSETRHLDRKTRREVDVKISAGICQMGPRSAAACARRHAYQADPEGYVQRGRTERKNRRVTLRAAPDTMSLLSGYLPAEQGVACLKSLRDQTDAMKAAGDPRCRDQIMADTLVERLTGQAQAADVNAEVQIVIGLDALLDANNQTPAELNGYGPLPADLARDLLATSKGKLWWRRLYAAPVGGPLVGGDPHRRHFDGHLKKLIRWRDGGCRDPFCDAPIRHLDHIQRYTDGGLTIYPNGRGACERGNYAREMPGWTIETVSSGLDGQHHTIKITTPTGHSYLSRAP
ncbi:MAG TPA: DUF222 domain-containing protein [Propionibacteriaceae bacterium]|nr:DUF222 domain-containing protein [Propionibacteriaceae bacterium]